MMKPGQADQRACQTCGGTGLAKTTVDGKEVKIHVDKSTKMDKVVVGDMVKAYITDKGHTTTLQRAD